MNRTQILAILHDHHAEINTFGVRSLMMFGSVARDEARADSDVDLLVEFSCPIGLFRFIELKEYLESILGCKVDLGTPHSLKPRLRERVLKEAIHVT